MLSELFFCKFQGISNSAKYECLLKYDSFEYEHFHKMNLVENKERIQKVEALWLYFLSSF